LTTKSNPESKLIQLLQSAFKLHDFRAGQQEIITKILEGHDLLAVLPTGAGKSLCYQITAVYKQQLVIVVSPLIALMKDQVTALRKLGIPSGCLYAGQDVLEKRAIFNAINQKGPFVLYLSPERIQKEGFAKWIKVQSIGLFAIDEAHCISQWGSDFREEYHQLGLLKELRPDINTLALTASATPMVLDDIIKSLKLNSPLKLIHGFYRPNLFYQVESCVDEDDKNLLLQKAVRKFPEGRTLIYCGTRKLTEEISHFLSQTFSKVAYYHAGLETSLRMSVQQGYMNGEHRILVATNAFGMGIDQADVRLVVHYNIPADIDSLYQQMGRAGRDLKDSTCIVLYSKRDKGLQTFFIDSSDAARAIKNKRWRALDAILSYVEDGVCRNAHILSYFSDSRKLKQCGHCDVCVPNSPRKIYRNGIQVIRRQKPQHKKL
jgi:ATP-dependent DNA helicase RecQ